MQQKLKPIAISLCLLGIVTLPLQALAKPSNDKEKISSRTLALENQVAQLKQDFAALKAGNNPSGNRHGKKLVVTPTQTRLTLDTSTANTSTAVKTSTATSSITQPSNLPNISGPYDLPQSGVQYLPIDLDVPGQSFVSTGPYIGVPMQFAGGDLIINNPSVNQDVALLNLRKNIQKRLIGLGLKPADFHSHLLLSGMVEAEANYRNVGSGTNSSDIDLTTAAIDAYILGPSTCTTGLISLEYDNSIGAQEGSLSINARTQNSRVFVNKAFIIIGDFTRSPFYTTMGQMYVPFGTYSSTMISSPLTKLMFRTQARALLFGFYQQCKNAWYGSIYAFRGDSYVGATNRVNNGGGNIGYKFEIGDNYSGNFGAGVIANIADSQGMQNTGNGAVYVPPAINVPASDPVFGGFGGVAGTGSEKLVHRVPAYNLRGLFSIGKTWDFLAEYITASTRFNPADMTMEGHGARPQAVNFEAAYTFQCIEKPTSITFAYGATRDAAALGMPSRRYGVALNTSWWRNTLQSLEFRHDINYAKSVESSGSGVPGPKPRGGHDNLITAQFDLYF